MTKKRYKPVTPPPNSPKREEMVGNGRGSKSSSLSRRQQSALPVIAATPTMAQAARSSGIGESALYRWLEDPHFRNELTRRHHAARNSAPQHCHSEAQRGIWGCGAPPSPTIYKDERGLTRACSPTRHSGESRNPESLK